MRWPRQAGQMAHETSSRRALDHCPLQTGAVFVTSSAFRLACVAIPCSALEPLLPLLGSLPRGRHLLRRRAEAMLQANQVVALVGYILEFVVGDQLLEPEEHAMQSNTVLGVH